MSMDNLLHVPSFCNLKGILIRVLQRNRISVIYIYIYIYVCVCVCVYIYIYICIYTEGKIYCKELTPMIAGSSKPEIHWIRLES